MKIKSLCALVAIAAFSVPAAMAAELEQEQTYNREFLGGYAGTNIDNADASFKGFNVEYRQFVNDHFGFSGSLGYGYDSAGPADIYTGALDATAIVRMPIKKFYVYGKAGLSFTTASVSGTTCNYYGCYDVSVDDNDVTPIYGFGVSVPVKDRLTIDASYLIKKPEFDFGYGVSGKSDMRIFMLQAGWKF